MRLFLLIISAIISVNGYAQGLKVRGKTIVNAEGEAVLLRGMGLGGWMLQEPYMLQLSEVAKAQYHIRQKIKELAGDENAEKFYSSWLKNHCTRTDIDSLASWGFNAVRLPLHYNLFTLPIEEERSAKKQTWLQKGFEMTDSLLSWCKANKMYLILDLHAAPGGQGNDVAISDRDTSKPSLWQSELNRQKTIALWQKLAARYANEEWIGGYDLINEPNWGFENLADKNGCAEKSNKPLRKLYTDITAAIRKVDKKHIIFIEGNCWGNNYEGIFPLWDNQLVVSFHKYWNYTTEASIQNFLGIRAKYNVPIWMGETGENSNVWFTSAVELFERNNIGWTMWPLKKLGLNNPLQVKANPGYKIIIDYWKDKAAKPSPQQAAKSLMDLTEDIKAENNIYHKGVIDAMMRQVKTTATLPFTSHSLGNSATVFAANYDMGRIGYAYHDKDSGNYWVSTNIRTSGNRGGMYRNDGVDIQACSDSISNGYCVAWIEDGEWMQYTINNSSEGLFNIDVRSSSKDSTGELKLLVNDYDASTLILPKTGDHQHWQTSTFKSIKIPKGQIRIRLLASTGGFNFNYIKLERTNTTTLSDN